MRPIYPITLVVIFSAVIAWFGAPLVRENTDFYLAIVTLFAVFGGFLVAVMSIGADSALARSGSWATLELMRDSAIARMDRARLLFYSYLLSATLILIVLAIQKSCYPWLVLVFPTINFFAIWFTAMGLLFSFALPSMLIGIQKSKIDGQIENDRNSSTSK